jgi:hypothetical protein
VVHQTLFDVAMAPGRHYYWKSHYLPEFLEAAGNVLMGHAAKISSPHSSILVFQLGGALARFGETDTPAGNRNAAYVLNVAAAWEEPTHTDEQIAYRRRQRELSDRGGRRQAGSCRLRRRQLQTPCGDQEQVRPSERFPIEPKHSTKRLR